MGQLFDDVKVINIYAYGLCHLSVCAPRGMPRKRVEAAVNVEHPTGIKHQWKVTKENFETGESNPCPCNDEPKYRLHYLMNC